MERFIEVSPWFYVFLAGAILFLPVHILLSILTAACIHELFHIATLVCLRIPIDRIEIGAVGARIQAADMTLLQELICAAAGPIGSLSLLAVSDHAPILALVGLIQGGFNLLPIFPMDGGRMIRVLIRIVFPNHRKHIQRIMELIPLTVICFLTGRFLSEKLAVAMGLFSLGSYLKEKFLAKQPAKGYNSSDHV